MERRLNKSDVRGCDRPMMTAGNIHYEIADRVHGIAWGGIGAVHALAREIGLVEAIDERLHLLKLHHPYHESDHVLNFAFNALWTVRVCKIWNCCATMKFTWMPWGRGEFSIRPPLVIFAGVSIVPASESCRIPGTPYLILA